MTPEEEKVLEKIKVNDQHPERGEIKLITDHPGCVGKFGRHSFDLYEMWNESGLLIWRFEHKCERHHGLEEIWYENGQMQSRCTYKNGKKDGLCERWHKNGERAIMCVFQRDKIEGLEIRWSPDGSLHKVSLYRDCGRLERNIDIDANTPRLVARWMKSWEDQKQKQVVSHPKRKGGLKL